MIVLYSSAAVAAIVILLFYAALKHRFNYWKQRGVPHLKPSIPAGNYGSFITLKENFGEVAQMICQAFPDAPYIGTFFGTEPALLVQNPDLIKLVTTKDFYYFNAREIAPYCSKELTTQSLFFHHGEVWKVLRHNMTPMFTPAKMRSMFHLIRKCCLNFQNFLDEDIKMSNVIEAKSLMAKYTMDCITSCSFGIEGNTLNREISNNPFTIMGDMLFNFSNIRSFGVIFREIWPAIFYGLGFKVYPDSMVNFFRNMLMDVFKARNNTPSSRNDFVDSILKWKENEFITCDGWNNGRIKLKVEDNVLVSQCIVTFGAGYETSANALSFTMYELAKNQSAQKRAFEEVKEYLKKRGNKLDYDVTELVYLESCINEAMRLYPALGVVTREVVEKYQLPSGLWLDKGTRVHIPVYHIHRNPTYFPEPEEYRPERFLPENKENIQPYTYMPFGEGPRICIGYRQAKMQVLAGLVTILKKYQIFLADGMPRKVKLESKGIVNQAKGGIRLRLQVKEGWEERILNDGTKAI